MVHHKTKRYHDLYKQAMAERPEPRLTQRAKYAQVDKTTAETQEGFSKAALVSSSGCHSDCCWMIRDKHQVMGNY
ncbi:hypothetical protein RRG08_014340 [Elysia crispata]|uniref:Uncharacterized protein n=1 Tax=Elysia crispata TaxID=231223 RepID=A0AAE0XND7_9GAST|nr:hypothetical protein RRG08_014340 [Elysia crispata]